MIQFDHFGTGIKGLAWSIKTGQDASEPVAEWERQVKGEGGREEGRKGGRGREGGVTEGKKRSKDVIPYCMVIELKCKELQWK